MINHAWVIAGPGISARASAVAALSDSTAVACPTKSSHTVTGLILPPTAGARTQTR